MDKYKIFDVDRNNGIGARSAIMGLYHHPSMVHRGTFYEKGCPVTPDHDKYCIYFIIYTPEPLIIRTLTAHFVSGARPREWFLGGWCSTPRHIGIGQHSVLANRGVRILSLFLFFEVLAYYPFGFFSWPNSWSNQKWFLI
uniref:Uncharacterized mitochondrial protein ymf28 n=1 Tax=Marchantia polymorpha TaxID=3197 RepID=YMF28_MARPO|nr:hypothetical protein MapooMp15 [Marchantia paleacea]P38470.1 RecName: Full=Uncharacterized mitochondrial protein ymf28; AltName: Full=ORF139 [Marchantia polymorpha]AAC09409.1 ORF139 [Marchantia paleacea]